MTKAVSILSFLCLTASCYADSEVLDRSLPVLSLAASSSLGTPVRRLASGGACDRLDPEELIERFGCPKVTDFERQVLIEYNKLRESYGAPPVQIGNAVQVVARLHMESNNQTLVPEGCAVLHSWTDGPYLEEVHYNVCCYPKDWDCMWDKPQEIWGRWVGFGYELSAMYSKDWEQASDIISVFANSPDHLPLLINTGEWEHHPWAAVGIAVRGGLVYMWFTDGNKPKTLGYCLNDVSSNDDDAAEDNL